MSASHWQPFPPATPRICRLAVASTICALIGIPLFGLVTGIVAIVLGSLAFAVIDGERVRGTGWAICGILLGVVDVVGWGVMLCVVLANVEPEATVADFQYDLSAVEGADPVISRAMRANVLIETRQGWSGLTGRTIGSGVVLDISDDKALIVTNRHVVDTGFSSHLGGQARDADQLKGVTVRLIDELPEPARVVWLAPHGIDLALVRARCKSSQVQSASWEKIPLLHVGDDVFAIGNPHNLGWTHTQGTVSQFRTQGSGAGRVRVIQTQTAINSGNSGGGLYDAAGTLAGIITWSQDKRVSEGLSFAISLESLLDLVPRDMHLQRPVKPAAEESP